MRGVTTTVRQNFELVFEAFYGPEAGLKIKDFTTAYQDSPQQDTNCDCGIFVMNFMSSWDGRRVAHIDNVHFFLYCTYITSKESFSLSTFFQKNLVPNLYTVVLV